MSFPPNVICPQCGSVNPATNRFCRTCRNSVETAQTQTVTGQTPIYTSPQYAPMQPRPVFECPFCHTNVPPFRNSKISAAGWIVFAMMLLICFPLFWIGFFIKEEESICSQCGIKLG